MTLPTSSLRHHCTEHDFQSLQSLFRRLAKFKRGLLDFSSSIYLLRCLSLHYNESVRFGIPTQVISNLHNQQVNVQPAAIPHQGFHIVMDDKIHKKYIALIVEESASFYLDPEVSYHLS